MALVIPGKSLYLKQNYPTQIEKYAGINSQPKNQYGILNKSGRRCL